MGINIQVLKTILFENSYQPISGNVLLIGRSTVTIQKEQTNNYLRMFKKEITQQLGPNGNVTRHGNDSFSIDDKILFKTISNKIKRVDVLDLSPYEGADVIADLNYPVPEQYWNQYDFIYDSSVIDNLFNPASAIQNVHRMLKPKGRYLGLNVSSFYPGAMVACHPEWFYSFFAVNNYNDIKVYLTEASLGSVNRFEYLTNLYLYKPIFTQSPNYNHFQAVERSPFAYHTICIAEKSTLNDLEVHFPVNLQYLESSESYNWSKTYQPSQTGRPTINGEKYSLFEEEIDSTHNKNVKTLPHLSTHYEFLGSGF